MMDFGLQILGPLFDLFTNPSSRTHWIGLLVFSVVFVLWFGIRSTVQYIKHCVGQKSIHLDIQLLVFNRIVRTFVGWFGCACNLESRHRNNESVSVYILRGTVCTVDFSLHLYLFRCLICVG